MHCRQADEVLRQSEIPIFTRFRRLLIGVPITADTKTSDQSKLIHVQATRIDAQSGTQLLLTKPIGMVLSWQ